MSGYRSKAYLLGAVFLMAGASQETRGEYIRKVVCEEITGTWCMYCPSGTVAIEAAKEKYGDSFIAIAAHYGDVMALDGYADRLAEAIGNAGAPYAYTMRSRKYSGSPSDLDTRIDYLSMSKASAMITVSATSDNGLILAEGSIISDVGLDSGKWGVELILTEDDVYHPDDMNYMQQNAYSGNELPMGGFEKLPNPVPPDMMRYNDVARLATVVPEESLPAACEEGREYRFSYTFNVPGNVDDIGKCHLTALLTDASGAITNAWRSAIAQSGIGRPEAETTQPATVIYYDMLGRKVDADFRGIKIAVTPEGKVTKMK